MVIKKGRDKMLNKSQNNFFKWLPVGIVIVILISLVNVSGAVTQWSPVSNNEWFSGLYFNTPFSSFNTMPIYRGAFNNNPFPSYWNTFSPGLFSLPGLSYGNTYGGLYSGLTGFNNYASGIGSTTFYSIPSLSFNPASYMGTYPWLSAPPITLPYSQLYAPIINVTPNTGWTGIINVPWIQYPKYPTQPPANEDDHIIIKKTEGLLETRIHNALGLDLTEPITTEQAITLTSLDASGMCQEKWVTISGSQADYPTHKIKCEPPIDISLLAELTNLTELNLNMNTIGDISPLAELTKLNKLILSNTNTNDLYPLAELTNLTYLNIHGAEVSDLSPIAGLINLTELNLLHNKISDLSPLAGLTNLTYLNLGENKISGLSPLTGLINLKELDLHDNDISGLSPLTGLINLKELDLKDNNITDLNPLTGLTNLQKLLLYGNDIKDISPLAELNNLRYVSFRGNDNLGSGNCPIIIDLISRGVSVQTDLNCQ